MRHAFIFPGQGAQTVGMGKTLADAYPAAKSVFEEVDDALGERLSAVIWEGDRRELALTRNAQPALMATSMASMAALRSEGVTVEAATHVAGHSLGEYSALAAAGALSLSDTARLLRTRGDAMQEAVPVGEGAMAAILGLDPDTAISVTEQAARGDVCVAANDNDPGQVVVSGTKAAVERAAALARERGAKRAILLPVSAPFHCTLMLPAAERMAEELGHVEIGRPKVRFVSNVLASEVSDPSEIRALLVEQVTRSVRWRESVLSMIAWGVGETWEIGVGKALSGMVRRIDRSVLTHGVGTPEEVCAAAERLCGG